MFVSVDQYKDKRHVEEVHVAAAHIEPVDGGWMVFDSIEDYQVWGNQV